LELQKQYPLPFNKTDALVVAWNKDELKKLKGVVKRASANGVDVKLLSQSELLALEPNLSKNALGAALMYGESVVDPWILPMFFLHQALLRGAKLMRNSEVLEGTFANDVWELKTTQGPITASTVINCGGLYGDIVETIHRTPKFRITPRKGQFVVYNKKIKRINPQKKSEGGEEISVKHIIYPIPNERTKGVLISPTIHKDHLFVGPTAEDQNERSNPLVTLEVLQKLKTIARLLVPGLEGADVAECYAGLRPATQFSDYQIEAVASRRWITVAGIRSTGLSASLGIGDYVSNLYIKTFEKKSKGAKKAAQEDEKSYEAADLEVLQKLTRNQRLLPDSSIEVEINGETYKVTHPISRMVAYQNIVSSRAKL